MNQYFASLTVCTSMKEHTTNYTVRNAFDTYGNGSSVFRHIWTICTNQSQGVFVQCCILPDRANHTVITHRTYRHTYTHIL